MVSEACCPEMDVLHGSISSTCISVDLKTLRLSSDSRPSLVEQRPKPHAYLMTRERERQREILSVSCTREIVPPGLESS